MLTPNDSLSELFNPKATDNGFLSQWTVYPDLFYFQGHFPEMPIVPAVGIVDLSVACVAKHLGMPVALESVQQAKFYRTVGPAQKVQISGVKEAGGSWSLTWTDETDQSTLATLKFQVK